MNPKRQSATFRSLLVVVCAVILVPGDSLANLMPSSMAGQSSPQAQASKIPPEQLDSLVAPIALYPDEHGTMFSGSAVVGTTAGCDVVLVDRSVSRRHCEIFVRDQEYVVRDLGSTNGTFLGSASAAPLISRQSCGQKGTHWPQWMQTYGSCVGSR